MLNSNFFPRMLSWCVNRRRGADVFPRVQGGCYRSSTGVGGCVSAGALPLDVLLQLLDGLLSPDDRAFMDAVELCWLAESGGLLADSAALHVDCGARDVV